MKQCDCYERVGIDINSFRLFQELKIFFEKQVEEDIFCEVPVELPYFCGYGLKIEETNDNYKRYANKWYRCKACGTLWEFNYPDFPVKGFVRKFPDGKYMLRE